MNKEKKNIIILIMILTLLILIFINNIEVKQNIITATEIWLTQVFPSLFPMFIWSNILIAYEFPEILANKIGFLFTKIFHTSSYGVFVFIMSILAGTPSSAFIIKNLVETNKINEKEASYLLTFTFFSNPLFLMNILSLIFPQNSILILKIILIHYSSNLIIGFLFRPKTHKTFQKIQKQNKRMDLGNLISTSLKKSLDTLLLILGTICFYFIMTTILKTNNQILNIIISGFFELTQGLNKIMTLENLYLKKILAISFISFGGLSIHTQIKSIISDTNIKYLPFLKGRILHAIIGIIAITFL